MRILPRRLLFLGGAAAIAAGGFAYMASNSVAQTNAGVGQGQISGYTVSGVTYNLANRTDPYAFPCNNSQNPYGCTIGGHYHGLNPATDDQGPFIAEVTFTLTPENTNNPAGLGNVLAWFDKSPGVQPNSNDMVSGYYACDALSNTLNTTTGAEQWDCQNPTSGPYASFLDPGYLIVSAAQ